MSPLLPEAFLTQPVVDAARGLIGAFLTLDGAGGRIVETEAYDGQDAASHSFRGPTPRNAAMFGPAGRAYVYRSYGIHLCLNIVAGDAPGAAILIRAIEPLWGLDVMRARRGRDELRLLCAGPGRLCVALGISMEHNHLPVTRPPFVLRAAEGNAAVIATPRIGISQAKEIPWRFCLAGSPFLSRTERPQQAGAAPATIAD